MIVDYPDPILLRECEEIDPLSKICRKIVESLRVDMHAYRRKGIGLSAPQIGLSFRIFVMDNKFLGVKGSSAFINPKITWVSQETEWEDEGCLSFPAAFIVSVARPVSIEISAFDTRGRRFEEKMSGLAARCFQHEQDHLNGINLWNYASDKRKALFAKDLEKTV